MKLQRRVVNCGKIGHSAPAKHEQEIGHVKISVTKARILWAHETLYRKGHLLSFREESSPVAETSKWLCSALANEMITIHLTL